MLFGGRGEPFLRGLKVYYEREEERVIENLLRSFASHLPPLPEDPSEAGVRHGDMWSEPERKADLAAERETLFRIFDRISDLAARNGISVLYYTVQEYPEARGHGEPWIGMTVSLGLFPGVWVCENPLRMECDRTARQPAPA